MDPLQSRSVYRYLPPADAFVRILLCPAGEAQLRPRPGLDGARYRRLVIEACCPELQGDVGGRIGDLCPRDPAAAEEGLYRLCVEVNPALDIHTVRLVAERPGAAAAEAEPRAEDDARAFLRRLQRRSRELERRLARRVIGQGEAVAAVARAVRRAAAGLAEESRPVASFLLVGRTGTGKTELARRLAEELFGGRRGESLVRVDCSEYALAHEYAKLIGAPPGYVGHEHGGFLTDAVRRRPRSLVLFDEIEKAHPRLHHLLLQLLDEGQLTDGRGRSVDFSQTLVVLTSNVGAVELRSASRRVGFATGGALDTGSLWEITGAALERQFSPEFLGRIDERVLFRDLTLGDARRIAGLLLLDLARRTRRRGLVAAFSPAVAAWVARRGFDPASGARELRRVVQREIEPLLAEHLLARGNRARDLVRISIRRDRPALNRTYGV